MLCWCRRGNLRRIVVKTFIILVLITVAVVFLLEKTNGIFSLTVTNDVSSTKKLPGWQYIKTTEDQNPRGNHSTSCQVPKLSLETDTNRAHFGSLLSRTCTDNRLFYQQGSLLLLQPDVLQDGRTFEHCDYRAVERISDSVFAYSNPIRRTERFEVRLQNDFVLVECVVNATSDNHKGIKGNKTNSLDRAQAADASYDTLVFNPKQDYESRHSLFHWSNDDPTEVENQKPTDHQFIAQIHPKKSVLDRISKIKPPEHSIQMNVLLFCMDSMSHLNYQRTMPLTYAYLKDLGAVVLNSYNIVGDGTLAASTPLLTGHTEAELPYIKPGLFTRYADSYPFIWNQYVQSGYVTLYCEERPDIETFQMRTNGFKHSPVDHYMRAFWQAVFESDKGYRSSPWFYCLDGLRRHIYMMDYVTDLFEKYPNVPKFAFHHGGSLPHYNPNHARYMDADVRDFLKHLNDSGHLDNTLLVTMSDHGSRYDWARGTVQGKMEERLPMMSLRLPPAFQAKYPNAMKNLRTNADRLTTPFDIHETLQSILDVRQVEAPAVPTSRGISLFQEIPANRTCSTAGVHIHWCTCLQYQTLEVNDEGVRLLSQAVVDEINKKTYYVRKHCIQLTLDTVLSAQLVHPNQHLLKYHTEQNILSFKANIFHKNIEADILHYQVTIKTAPNDGLYEATVRGQAKYWSFRVIGDVSRINKYGDQPKCIQSLYPDLRKYCYCHE